MHRDVRAFRHTFTAMASPCAVVIGDLDARTAAAIALSCENEVRRIEQKFSRYLADSVVSAINRAARRGGDIDVDAETMHLCRFADSLHQASDGAFDLTSGVLRHAWRFDRAELPSPASIDDLRERVGWSKITLGERSLRFNRPGMEVDFGGIGKEYAADRAAAVARGAGARSGFVELGGDLAVFGPQPTGEPWRIGIRHPRRDGATIASIEISHGGLATSGDYERFIIVDGQRYCHILDPRTGYPARGWQSITVLAPICIAAGAMATIAMVKAAQAIDWLSHQKVGFLAVDEDGGITRGPASQSAA